MVNGILGGQIIFTVSGGHTGVSVGIIVVSVLTWFIATVGMHVFHVYTRYISPFHPIYARPHSHAESHDPTDTPGSSNSPSSPS